MAKSIYVCGMEKKKTMMVNVELIAEVIEHLKELQ